MYNVNIASLFLFWCNPDILALRDHDTLYSHVLWYLLRTQEIRVSLGGNMDKWCHSTALEPDREVQPDSAGGSSDSRQCQVNRCKREGNTVSGTRPRGYQHL